MSSSESSPVVLITGANTGIGYQTAGLLAQSTKSYNIIITSRSLTKGQAAAAKLLSSNPSSKSTVTAIELDITSAPSISAALLKVIELHNRLDILVNNAAIGSDVKGVISSGIDDFKSVFDTNVIGTATVTDAFIPMLCNSKDGKLVVVSSSVGSITMAAAQSPGPHSLTASAYASSKAAVNMLIVKWSKAYGEKGVKVWGVDPGLCATDFAGEYSMARGRDPAEGGAIVVDVIEGRRDADVGRVCFDQYGEAGVRPW